MIAREATPALPVAAADGAMPALLAGPGEAPVSNQQTLLAAQDRGFIGALGPGQPLDPHTRQRMEAAFGASFSEVQIHAGPAAGQATRRASAQALTVGNHIAFAPGNYRPGTPVGDAMLAHELAHTLQQSGTAHGTAPGTAPVDSRAPPTDAPGTALESDAELSAAGVMLRLWGRAAQAQTAGYRETRPALRSALRVQRCSCAAAPGPVATQQPINFESRHPIAAVAPGLRLTDEASGRNLRLQPHRYAASGTVVALGGSDAEAPSWEAGYTQTALNGHRVHNYSEIATGQPMVREIIDVSTPSLDGGPDVRSPWYDHPASFATARARVNVAMDDTPTDRANWEDTGHQVQLVSTSGRDHFCSWLMVKHRSSDQPIYLNWDTWEVDWSSDVDRPNNTATATGAGGARVTDAGPGQGALTPVLRPPYYNDRLNDPANRNNEPWDGTP